MFKLIDHKYCTEDPYTKEIAIIEISLKDDSKLRFVYVRKEMKTGGMIWGPVNCSVMIDGQKQHFKTTVFDSNFLEQDIKSFLNNRGWEKNQPKIAMMGNAFNDDYKQSAPTQPQYEQTSFIQECPF